MSEQKARVLMKGLTHYVEREDITGWVKKSKIYIWVNVVFLAIHISLKIIVLLCLGYPPPGPIKNNSFICLFFITEIQQNLEKISKNFLGPCIFSYLNFHKILLENFVILHGLQTFAHTPEISHLLDHIAKPLIAIPLRAKMFTVLSLQAYSSWSTPNNT